MFPSRRKVIFVQEYFWHGHDCKRGARIPQTNREYWIDKIERNRLRDKQSAQLLHNDGWGAFVVWECAIANAQLAGALRRFLDEAPIEAPSNKPTE